MSPDLVTRGPHYLRRGDRSFLPVGAHYVPVVGPDWPWRVGPESFDRAFGEMAAHGLDAVRIDLLWAAIEPEPGRYDEAHLRQLDRVLEAARRHGVLLHPTLFIGGEVGAAFWDVPWRDGRHAHRDPELLELQRAHASMLARRWRGHPAIVAWDLTDEPPFWIFPDTTDDDARAWTDVLVDAIRAEDPEHLITIGTSEEDTGWGPFRADVVADRLDFACVHPYPIYHEELFPDALLSTRMTLAGAFETALAAGAGTPVMVHEYGASNAQFEPEAIAAYDRLLSWSSLGRGTIGFFAWCWTDAEPTAFSRVPYARAPHETQFGVTDRTGELRPRGEVLADLAATVKAIDLDGLAGHGPAPATAAIVVPHEWVRPFDRTTYGLDDPPGGPFEPVERTRDPHPDALSLSKGWLNAYVLASRADVPVAFPREAPAGAWPDVPLLLMPAPLATTSTTLHHVRTDFWAGAQRFFDAGGTLWISCSADVAIPEMETLAGCRTADRAPLDRPSLLRFVRPWGPFREGDRLELPGPPDRSLRTRGVRLALAGADPIAVDVDDEPALVVDERGPGHAVTFAFPVELLLADTPDAHGPDDRTWGLYAGLAELAGARGPTWTDDPNVVAGTLLGPRGGLTVLTNHAPDPVDLALHLDVDPAGVFRIDRDGEHDASLDAIHLEAHGAAIVGWET
jgi:Cellulase (glycosyl hydrolase family 5)